MLPPWECKKKKDLLTMLWTSLENVEVTNILLFDPSLEECRNCFKNVLVWLSLLCEVLSCFFLPGAIKLQDSPLAVPCPYWPVLTVLVLSEP